MVKNLVRKNIMVDKNLWGQLCEHTEGKPSLLISELLNNYFAKTERVGDNESKIKSKEST